jgi:hemerythrin
MEITISDLVTFLGTVPGFKDLSKVDVEQKVVPIIGISRFEPGQTIIKYGDSPHTLFIIYQGRVHGKITTPDNQEHHFFINEGNIFGESALVSNNRRNSTVSAAASTLCLTLDIDTFQQIMIRDWRFTKAFLILTGERIIDQLVRSEVEIFRWSDKFKIGVTEVDDQHKRLFEAINELGEFLNKDKEREETQKWSIQAFIVELLNYIEKHFQDEEQMMAKAKAPWLEDHQKIHRGLAANILEFRDAILVLTNEKEQLHMLEQIHKFMGNWLIQHIMKEDVKFGKYYKELATE